ncbi:hypothetical protein BCD_0001 [Borrelia crocidurae DOU]|uniref:Uncharacterized protein n=1 Tax=Borrelia crocidurae DOU TaxID=1293575 RepID=W5SGM7_9SPIR|nr:hypothetical protein BCD_0001 [Borrelia crocidurae DOU]
MSIFNKSINIDVIDAAKKSGINIEKEDTDNAI